MATWRVEEVKTRFGELMDRALTEGPQTITRPGAEVAVLLSIEDCRAPGSAEAGLQGPLARRPQG